jgi:hypothetical protein
MTTNAADPPLPDTPTIELPPQDATESGTAPEQTAPRDAKTQRLDRIMQTFESVMSGFLPELLKSFGPPAEHAIYGGLHCAECRAARATLRKAVLDLEDHLETTHDIWPSSVDASLDQTHKAISQVSRSLRLIDREPPPEAQPNDPAGATTDFRQSAPAELPA